MNEDNVRVELIKASIELIKLGYKPQKVDSNTINSDLLGAVLEEVIILGGFAIKYIN